VRCFFCKDTVYNDHRPVDRHHRLPRRYFKRGQDHRSNNIVLAHSECHVRFGLEHDRPAMRLQEYIPYMETINWGEGIYSPA
jgi:5-methylcytosine-specific restriction endonuclease McrA